MNLDDLLKQKGIDPDSNKAQIIRSKLRSVVPTMSDLDAVLSMIDESQITSVESAVTKAPNASRKPKKVTVELIPSDLIKYKDACSYVRRNSLGINAETLLANVISTERGRDYFYRIVDINQELLRAKKLNLYRSVD